MNIGPPLLANCDRCGHPCDTDKLVDDGLGHVCPACRVVRKPRRIQLRRIAGWRKPPGVISVARPSKWGNPAVIGQPITFWHPVTDAISKTVDTTRTTLTVANRGQAVGIFRALLTDPAVHMDNWGLATGWEAELRGHDLACWCPLDGQPCHADVLLELAQGARY